MRAEPAAFYDDLAEHYHLIFEDWDRSIERQAGILGPIIESVLGESVSGRAPLSILDCACGIGTQAIGLARRGYTVTASDVSSAAVARARREAAQRGLVIEFSVADMRDLSAMAAREFDVVLAADNALPHLVEDGDLARALGQIKSRLRKGGLFLATMRDYDTLIQSRPKFQPPAIYSDYGFRRIVHQVWDWQGDEYSVHLYITVETGRGWTAHHFVSRYRALQRADLFGALQAAGFKEIQLLDSAETSFYQPIVIARRQS